MDRAPFELLEYFKAEKALVCELDVQPYGCEFWPLRELAKYNEEYQVETYAPGYFGFGTSGGGEMFAISPDGAVVCLPFIGMSPAEELPIARSWSEFESLLKLAVKLVARADLRHLAALRSPGHHRCARPVVFGPSASTPGRWTTLFL